MFEKGRLYQGDFFNPYIDFPNFSLKLPGFSLKVLKYIGDKTHCLRYVFKNRETGDLYFNINFTLLWGEQLLASGSDPVPLLAQVRAQGFDRPLVVHVRDTSEPDMGGWQ